ncbi:GH92 family glycosyl hydrolase [Flagellimonas algicola]|uniref:Glycoside hydrolase family 92 protein n=1 Tax=Flagellimonas algicola TaxID=2583815 RepID=A0ABY2WM49_9FLAO|nr:GH92 family glycosyl hydrolase [Allomuricauda algicola]TMU56056.1 glycoside hydrolase family 92 protein [Allomuricauda algicola]
MRKNRFILLVSVLILGCSQVKETPVAAQEDYVDLVYPFLDTANSRWFFFSSASRPFGMVNLSPDTETEGAWGSGYRYKTTNIKGFSHVHAWQMSGPSVMPLISDGTQKDYANFHSDFTHETEKVHPGYHYVELQKHGINVELTSTTRVGFHQYSFPSKSNKVIMFNLEGQNGPSKMIEPELEIVGNKMISGKVVNAPTSRRPKPITVYFHALLDTAIETLESKEGKFLIRLDDEGKKVKMKLAISYTSIANAKENMEAELSHWDFDEVVQDSRSQWNQMLGRVKVEGNTQEQRRRFYTDLWHALQGRRIISDVNGAYPDNTNKDVRIGQIPLDQEGNPKFNHYNSDSFWGAQWTIAVLWQLVYPEIADEFVQSLLQYYQDGGMVPRGPSGGNYTYVMTGASATPFMVGAYQKGIRGYDPELLYEGLRKNHMSGGIMARAGYEHKTTKGGGLEHYISEGYVPYPNPEGDFGGHQDGASMTLEYAYQDYALDQLAESLGKIEDQKYFLERSKTYKNVFDSKTNWIRPKNDKGEWKPDFDPHDYQNGFVEANGSQATWFVPHDLEGLAQLMGGKQAAVKKLQDQFMEAEKMGFTSGTSHAVETHPEYKRIPINYGNQPSMQTAHVFYFLDRPDLTQLWVRKVVDDVYSGLSPETGYNGDEDQGLMGSLAVLLKMGLFQMTAGVEAEPKYIVTKPIFDRLTIQLDQNYFPGKELVIEVEDSTLDAISKLVFNHEEIPESEIRHSELVKGGILVVE